MTREDTAKLLAAMMSDLISRQSVIDAVTKYCTQYDLRELLADIEVMPSAQKTGYWTCKNIEGFKVFECSNCGIKIEVPWDYCPACGTYTAEERVRFIEGKEDEWKGEQDD